MASLRRIWNARLSGLPSALVLGAGIALRIVRDWMATLLWRGNLGAMGRHSCIQSGVTIRYPGNVHIGVRTSIARDVEITTETSCTECWIGSDVIIGVGVRLDFSGGLVIDDDVVISDHATLFTHTHGLQPKSVSRKTPLEIEPGVWIGSDATIVDGVTRIRRGAIVAAGAVVTKEVPEECIVAGVPARIVKRKL